MRSVLLALLVGCATIPRPIAPPGLTRTADEQRETTVQIDVSCKDGHEWRNASGTGVMVSDWQVLTMYHVVRCDGEAIIYAYNFQGRFWKMYRSSTWKDRDVALLELPDNTVFRPSFKPPLIRTYPPNPAQGESLFLTTAVPGRTEIYGTAIGMSRGTEFYYDADTVSGNSGSPVWDGEGHLVGLHGGRITLSDGEHRWGSLIQPDEIPH